MQSRMTVMEWRYGDYSGHKQVLPASENVFWNITGRPIAILGIPYGAIDDLHSTI